MSELPSGWEERRVNVLDIIRGTTVDGPGFRTSIYLAGCSHGCPGCHNPSSWSNEAGTPMTLRELDAIVEEEDFDVTLTGGDPLFNPNSTLLLVSLFKTRRRNVWLYTGYTWEQILSREELLMAVEKADVIVDSPFVEALRDRDLLFRGSSNQRLIDVARSLRSGLPVLWQPMSI